MTTTQVSAGGAHEERLNRLIAENQALREQLIRSQRLAALGTMTAMVAHDFRNFLTPVINYAELARTRPEMVEKAITRAIERGRLATDVCDAIMGIAGEQPSDAVEVDLSELIARTIMALGRDPKRDGIEVVLLAPADLTMLTRKVELQQLLLNLLMNARTAVLARPMPRKIEVRAERCGDSIVIRVSDNGIGIPHENQGRIFDPFFTTRGDSDAERSGHGLGLAICKLIVASLGGEIAVQSAPDCGATFTVCLPA